jgi:Na+/H+-dicarboxylate symporter
MTHPEERSDANARGARFPFALKIVVAMALGVVTGECLGTRAAPLSQLGTVILDLIKALAGPLLLFAIIDAFLRTELKRRSAGLMVAISLFNASIAVLIGLTISNILQPGLSLKAHLTDAARVSQPQAEAMARASGSVGSRQIDFTRDLLAQIPNSIARPFVDNAILSIVILAVLAGAALRRVKREQLSRGEHAYHVVEAFIATGLRAIEVALGWVIALVPLAVFGVVAKTVGDFGLAPLRGLAVYLGVGLLGLSIQILIVYQAWIRFVARLPVRVFWSGAREALVYALGTGSSLATLPVTLKSLERMGVSPESARMAACVGTNLNNDGILLYEAMAVLFVAQACGVQLSISSQLLAAAACVVAGIGISGIPEAGFISLLVVLRTVRVIPDEQISQVLPLLLTVDWVLGRARSVTNVSSDMLVAVLLDRMRADRPSEQHDSGRTQSTPGASPATARSSPES